MSLQKNLRHDSHGRHPSRAQGTTRNKPAEISLVIGQIVVIAFVEECEFIGLLVEAPVIVNTLVLSPDIQNVDIDWIIIIRVSPEQKWSQEIGPVYGRHRTDP